MEENWYKNMASYLKNKIYVIVVMIKIVASYEAKQRASTSTYVYMMLVVQKMYIVVAIALQDLCMLHSYRL